jgi:diguanylate cyclase (GGDEF)-like protein/PAS domain S-box-containing protein
MKTFSAKEKILKLNKALEENVQQLLATQEELEQHRADLEQEVARRTASLTEAQRIAHLGNWEWDLINNTVSWSDEMYRIFGYAPQQIGASYEAFLNLVHPEDRQLVDDAVREALARQHTYSIEHRILQPDGTLRHVHGQAEVMQGEDGQPISMMGTFQDITERKLVEQELHDSEERYRNLLETTNDWVWEVDENAVYTYASPRAHAILGYQPAEIIGKTPFDLMKPAEAKRVASLFGPLIAAQQPILNLENTCLHKDGHPVVLETSGVPILDADGKLCGYRGIDRDITERKLAENMLHDSEQRLRTIFDGALDGIALADMETWQITAGNSALCQMLGYSAEELARLSIPDLHTQQDWPSILKQFEKQARGELKLAVDIPVKRKDGSVFYADLNTSPVYIGGKHYIVGVFRDVTERKQAQAELRESELAYRTLAQNLPGMVYRVFIHEGGRMQFSNAMPTQMTGYAADELTTGEICSIDPLILDEDRPGVVAEVMRAIAEKRAFAVEYRLKRKDGGIRWMTEHGMPVYGTDDAPLYIDGVIFDITEHKQDEIELKLFRTLLDNSSDAIEVIDPATMRLLDVNETQCRELGYSREELLTMSVKDIETEFTANQILEFKAQILQNGEGRFESTHRRKDDTTYPVEVRAKLVEIGKPYLLSIVSDITDRKLAEAEVQKLQEQLREQALHDPLTGLYNRRYLDETIARELVRAARYKQPIGIVMCDLDHFKRVNDTHGHLAGDEVLRVFAELLKKHARGSDIVCRFGGEEFVMFLPDMPAAVAYQRAEQLRVELAAKRITLGAAVIQVTASFGVAAFPENGKTMDSLISAVDTAMYQAKEAGRDRVVVASAHEEDVPDCTEMDSAEVSSRKDKRRTNGH